MKILRVPVSGHEETALVLDLIVAVEKQSSYVINTEWVSIRVTTAFGQCLDVGAFHGDGGDGDRVYEQIVAALEAHEPSIEVVR